MHPSRMQAQFQLLANIRDWGEFQVFVHLRQTFPVRLAQTHPPITLCVPFRSESFYLSRISHLLHFLIWFHHLSCVVWCISFQMKLQHHCFCHLMEQLISEDSVCGSFQVKLNRESNLCWPEKSDSLHVSLHSCQVWFLVVIRLW